MTPTSFAFTVTLPGDARFVGAVRQLAVQAATYAKLPNAAGEALAHQVERATESAIRSAATDRAPIEVRFSGDEDTVTVVIGCDAARPATPPASTSANGVSVDWSATGSRLTCHIRQPTAA